MQPLIVNVSAEAYGQGQEHGLLEPMIEKIEQAFSHEPHRPLQNGKILADSGYCNKDALTYLEQKNIDDYIADNGFRSRDPRFKDDSRFKTKLSKRRSTKSRFTVDDFTTDTDKQRCTCPLAKNCGLNALKQE